MLKQRTLFAAFAAYLTFVVYGSLIPFDLRLHDLDQAVDHFTQIPWLKLGAASRADWVANLVLYVPLAFLGCSALGSRARSAGARLMLALFVLMGCLAVAIAVEFTQTFFAPRTVSLNDLLAESLGSLTGIALWLSARDRLAQLGAAFQSGGRESITALIAAYLALYLSLTLFPFDFVISWGELNDKLQSGNFGWLLAGTTAEPLRTSARLIGEGLAIAPLGLLAAMVAGRANLGRVFVAGTLFGLALELLQLFVVSGVTQGASALVRGAGLAAGAFVGQQVHEHGLMRVAQWVSRIALPLVPVYLLSVAVVSGWFTNDILSLTQGFPRFDFVQLVPFYFHYFTSEPVAMASVLANLAMYAPVGLYAWSRQTSMPRARQPGIRQATIWATLIALPIELSKLWLAGKHPDFTNLLIAATGSAISYGMPSWMARASSRTHHHAPEIQATTVANGTTSPSNGRAESRTFSATKATSLIFLLMLGSGLALHPLALPWVALLLLVYGIALWRFPWSWLLLLPMLLPAVDLAPYAGRLLFDEFDLLVLLTLGLGYWRHMEQPPTPWSNNGYRIATPLLLASGLIATSLGLRPLLGGAPASLASSHSAIDAALVGKGLFEALFLGSLLRRIPYDEFARAKQWLIGGLAAGLALLGLIVLWERHRFVGIADFDGVFRVTGNFSSMNNGGAYIEAFIAISFPALVVWTLEQRQFLLRLGGVAAAAFASYAMFVTFSRGGYAGLLVGLVIVLTFFRAKERHNIRHGLWMAGLTLAAIAAATPVLLGGFAQGRLAQIERDLSIRLDHWGRALDLMEPGVLPMLTGVGFGRYPALYLWHSDAAEPPGTFAVEHEQDKSFLRLGAGDAYYLDQIVRIKPGETQTLQARIRFQGDQQSLVIFLCEKALLYSFRCNTHELQRPDQSMPGEWHLITTILNTSGLGETGRWPSPTLKLSVGLLSGNGAIDIDFVSLRDGNGEEQLVNGDFEQGLDRWLSATDRDLAWHIHQSVLEVYFAQGLLGIVAVWLALLAAATTLLPRMRYGEPFAVAIGAGLAGFLTVGLLGSAMDTARTSLLFYLLIFAAGNMSECNARGHRRAD